MAESHDLNAVVARYLDPHLVLPIIGFLQVRVLFVTGNNRDARQMVPSNWRPCRLPWPDGTPIGTQGKGMLTDKESLRQQNEVLSRTKLVDYHIEVSKAMSGSKDTPKELDAKR